MPRNTTFINKIVIMFDYRNCQQCHEGNSIVLINQRREAALVDEC